MMKSTLFTLGVGLVVALEAAAQDVPLQRPEERRVTREQSEEIYDVIRPVGRKVSGSTVWVWVNRRQVAMGTVVGDGSQVLTKWSEIALARTPVQVVGGDGKTATASVLGVYRDEDLALLQLTGATFTPIRWSEAASPELGNFLIAAGPDDNPLSLGVVAVSERTLRESDQAFIGITIDPSYEGSGVRVRDVDDRGGADEAGIRKGDVLLRINDRVVTTAFELRNILLDFAPGDKLNVELERDGDISQKVVELGGRPKFQGVPEGRLRAMRQMGGPISVVGNGFPLAIQTDMQLKPHQCGGPVVDLQGNPIGLTISRTDRTRSFIIPASRIREMLETDPTSPALAQVPGQAPRLADATPARPRPRAVPMNPRAAGRLRQHLEEMSRLLDRMDREMQGIGE